MLKRVYMTAGLIAIVGCGGSDSGSTGPNTPPPGNTPVPSGGISVTNNAFSPAAKTVAVGTTVQWSWNTCDYDPYGTGTTCGSHTVTFDDGTGSQQQDKGTFARQFTAAGTYNYHCTVHGTAMSGSVTVQ